MKELRIRKRKTMVMGLLIFLVPGGIWSAGQLIHASSAPDQSTSKVYQINEGVLQQPVVLVKILAESLAGEAHAAEPVPPSVVRKKLPAASPAPGAQAAPAAPPAAAVPAPTEAVQPPKEPAPTPAATPSVQTPVPPSAAPAVPQRPMVASPKPEAPPAQAPAALTPPEAAPKPETAAASAAPPPAPPIVKPFAVAAPKPSTSPKAVSAAKPAVAAPKPVIAAVPTQGPRQAHPYSVLLASCREPENAQAALSQYRRPGFSPYIVRTEVPKKGVWWRTLMGSFKTLQEALAAINRLKLKDAVVVKTPYANLVGEFSSEKDAAQAAEQLNQKGLHPYPVNGSSDSVLLVVGGFATSQAAESYRQELEAKGVATQVVRR